MLETIGYDAATAASFAPWDAADASVGRVARVDRGVLTVLTEDGPQRVTLGGDVLRRMAAEPSQGPVPGDWCVVRSWPDGRLTLEHVLPRRTAVPGPGCDPLGANIDLVAVVLAFEPPPDRARVRRLLDVARGSGAEPVVVLTGAGPAPGRVVAAVDAAATGVEVVTVDVATGAGTARVRELLAGHRTVALVGPPRRATGSLTEALVGTLVLGGRRSRRELVVLPGGGAVIDLGLAPTRRTNGWSSHGEAR